MSSNEEIVGALMVKARAAQKQVQNYTQEQIDEVVFSVAWQLYKDENIAVCAKSVVEETGMGVYEDKLTKHKVKVLGACRDVKNAKTVGLIERDEVRGLTKYAKPVGVIGALTPVTNPTATIAGNAISILKGRNAVIFAPHPGAKKSSGVACEFMREGLRKVGAPVDLIQYMEEPSVPLSQELMRQVDLVVATGGAVMVKAAYSSGTPAYGVGAGNPVIIVAEDADLVDAAQKIRISKTFDNATSCSSDNSLLIQVSVFDKMVVELQKQGGYLCSPEEKKKLESWMWVASAKTGHVALNPKTIAISARRIADYAGIAAPDGTKMLMVIGEKPGEERFSGEKLSPVMALWRYKEIEEAIELIAKLHNYAGLGHSCGIYSFNPDYIRKVGLGTHVSRVLVRQPQAPAAGGNFYNGMPSTVTLSCGTWGGNISNDNIHWKHFINVTWVSEPVPESKPTDEEIWGSLWKKYGR